MKSILIKITKEGKIVSQPMGVKGTTCVDIDKFITSLGCVEKEVHTDEYYENEVENVDLNIQ